MITHTRVRWTSQRGVEFVARNYSKYPAREGYTDIRYWEIDLRKYDMDILIDPGKTLAQFAAESDAEIVMNGAYADGGKALGHIVKNGKIVNDTVATDPWIDFIVRDGVASIEQLDPKNIVDIELSLSGTPQIIKEGKIFVNTWGEKTPSATQATINRPRTAATIKKDGTLLFAVVDGDSPKYDAGITCDRLAAVMIKLGAWDGMCFDGGGSSAVAQNGKVISGNKGHRELGSCIIFSPKKIVTSKPDTIMPEISTNTRMNDIPVSKNFKLYEFECKDGNHEVKIDPRLLELLQKLRTKLGKPITITSAYRTPEYNATIPGAAANSQHVLGKAADIKVSGMSPQQVADEAERIGFTGIGIYSTFTHVDVRDTKSKWRG